MKRLTIGVLVGLCVGATGAPADKLRDADGPTPLQAANAAAEDYLAPLAAPDNRRVRIRVAYCRDRGRWHGCRVRVAGKSRCHGVLRVQIYGDDYGAWMPRMRCR